MIGRAGIRQLLVALVSGAIYIAISRFLKSFRPSITVEIDAPINHPYTDHLTLRFSSCRTFVFVKSWLYNEERRKAETLNWKKDTGIQGVDKECITKE
ncbi:hypothetical protein KQX54_007176 [Cotesia glomerata]|uniref:Uncharacterized protein n=1 Tax=Cotesia glomerata TaxID=32391 RepID=A0AAV7J6A9_COTGL|nr:hypothetical protein KQX54_007176 [Cotesia glomerata]